MNNSTVSTIYSSKCKCAFSMYDFVVSPLTGVTTKTLTKTVNCVSELIKKQQAVKENLVTVENSYLTRVNELGVLNVNTATKICVIPLILVCVSSTN